MATYNINIRRWNGSSYDILLPTPRSHASSHSVNGSDPITIGTGNIENSAVTTAKINNSAVTADKIGSNAVTTAKINNSAVTAVKIADGAVTTAVTVTIPAMQANTESTVTVNGVTATNSVIVTPSPTSFVSYIEAQVRCIRQSTNSLTFIATEATNQLTANVLIINK